MNKKFSLFLLISIIGILFIFNIEKVIQDKVSILNTSTQSTYIKIATSVNDSIKTYFDQLEYIDYLKESNQEHLQYKTLYDIALNELNENNVQLNLKTSYQSKLDLEPIKVLSYLDFKDYSRVRLDIGDLNSSNIYALITYDGFSAGILHSKNDSFVGYLNENNKCNYAVFIGEDKSPGITSGVNENGNLLVKYVPIWKKVLIGDEIITSGMDSIFPYGVKVGKVIDIEIQDNIQEILVKPYAKTLGNRDYFLYNYNIK